MNELRSLRIRKLLPIILLGAGLGAAPAPDPVEPAEKAASEWIKTRLETTRIETAWTTEKPLLEATVNGMRDRAKDLEDQRDEMKAKSAKDREEIDAIVAKNEAATNDLNAAVANLSHVVDRLIALRPSLPPRLSDALEMSYKSLGNAALGPSERMQTVMTILNRCSQFNRVITNDEEALALDGGTGLRSLEVVYWGLGHGYALDRPGGKAWYGAPGPHGWAWEPLQGGAEQVAHLIAMCNDKADPEFVAVPARLGRAEGGQP
jgi:hypothetical protein